MKLGIAIVLAAAVGAGVAQAQPVKGQQPAPPAKRKVFLNGVDLENVEVPPQSFAGCEVRFDDKGNLHIRAPGFQVGTTPASGSSGKVAPAPATPAPPPAAAGALSKQYFVAVEENAKGMTRWDVVVYINGQRITLIRAAAGATAFEITKWLKPGDNTIRLVAAREAGGGGSTSAEHYLQIVAGEGTASNGQVVIQTHLVLYRRYAAESGGYDNTYKFTAR